MARKWDFQERKHGTVIQHTLCSLFLPKFVRIKVLSVFVYTVSSLVEAKYGD